VIAPWRRAAAPIIGALLAFVLAACLGDSATPAATPTLEPLATPVSTTYPLEATVWVEGLVVTVHQASAVLDSKGGPVTVTMRIENDGTLTAALDVPLVLNAGGQVFEPVSGTNLPEIDPGASQELSIVFDVEGRASVDDGVLRIGRPADHQAAIPFDAGAPGALTLQPDVAALTTGATAGDVRIVLRRREVRWDLPDWYQELPLATEALTVTYDVTYVGTFSGGFAFTAANVALQLPNGTLVHPRADGRSQSVALIGPQHTARNLFSRFEIPSGTAGKIALVIVVGSVHHPVTFVIAP
jgi:hypothetical protein